MLSISERILDTVWVSMTKHKLKKKEGNIAEWLKWHLSIFLWLLSQYFIS